MVALTVSMRVVARVVESADQLVYQMVADLVDTKVDN